MIAAFTAGFLVVAAMWLVQGGSRSRLRTVATVAPQQQPLRIALPHARLSLRRHDHRLDVVRLADGWAGELTAGRPTVDALRRAFVLGPPAFLAASRRLEHGTDPAMVLNEVARLNGGQGALALVGCWQVAASGGALATTVGRTADALRLELALRDEIAAQVAAPRATARLVAALPLFGPLLGALVGANTLAVLFGTGPGRVMLIGGLALDGLGWWWVRRLVGAAEQDA